MIEDKDLDDKDFDKLFDVITKRKLWRKAVMEKIPMNDKHMPQILAVIDVLATLPTVTNKDEINEDESDEDDP